MDLFVRTSCWMLLWLKILYRFVNFLRMFLEDLEIKDGQHTLIVSYCLVVSYLQYILYLVVRIFL